MHAHSYIQHWLVYFSPLWCTLHLQEEIDAAYSAQDAHSAYYDAVNRVAAAASQLSSAAKLQSTTYTDSERAEAEDVLDACQPAIDDVNYSESFAGSGMLASCSMSGV